MDKEMHEDRLNTFFTTLSSELADKYGRSIEKREAISRQAERARKRARYERPFLEPLALEKFLQINAEVKGAALCVDPQILRDAKHFICVALERFTSRVDPLAVQSTLCMEYLYDNWRFGPGASNGIKGTHAAEKIVQAMTCTARCETLVSKLRVRNAYFAGYDSCFKMGTRVVEGSRMTTVPKNEDTVRTIAIEPSGNMALQLAAGHYLEETLRMIGLDIRCQQPRNKELARIGSVTNRLATIDLSAASDRISLALVRALFPPEWVELLETIRSSHIEVPGFGSHELAMVSTMGNGFTFPLMTLIICSLIYGYRAQRRSSPNLFIDWTFTAVFGDDIIIPSHEFGECVSVLVGAGLVVNYDKSYSDGPFRESCGGDFFRGYDITPFYVKSLATPADCYVAINQTLAWCARHEIVMHRTLLCLLAYVQPRPFLVPEWYNPDQGILTAQCRRRFKYLSLVRFEKRLTLDNPYTVMLACGGYLTSRGPDIFYSPRLNKPKMSVRSSRLPEGYLDGWCADRYTKSASIFVSMILDILM
jgi:hypothetical protein